MPERLKSMPKKSDISSHATHEDGYSLSQALKPIRILTKVVSFIPEWVTKPSTPLAQSRTDVLLLIISVSLVVGLTASFGASTHTFIANVQLNQEFARMVQPLLWTQWVLAPVLTHAFILLNLNRLREFFHFLTEFTTQNLLLQLYPVTLPKKAVLLTYCSAISILLLNITSLAIYLQEYYTDPSLITSLPSFQSGPLWFLATFIQLHGVCSVSINVITVDLGIGFVFYFMGRMWRSAAQFVADWSVTWGDSALFNDGASQLWQSYEEFLGLLHRAESLFGFLVVINQLNHLLGTAFFIYAGIRMASIYNTIMSVGFVCYSILFIYRTVVFTILLSAVYNEHQAFQDALAQWLASHRSHDTLSYRLSPYFVIRDLLYRAQSIVVAVTPYNIYSVTPSILSAIFSTIVTYLVILLQTK